MPFEFIEDADLRQKATDEFNASLDALKAETAKQIQAEVDKQTSGLKKSQQQLLDEKKKLQDRFKDITDPEEALKALQLIRDNEEVRLLADGKIDEVIQRRLSNITQQHEDAISELNTKLTNSEMSSTKYKSFYNDLIIENNIRAAAVKAGIQSAAIEDVLNRGRILFSVGEDERTVEARDKDGKLRKTEDDKVLTPENWIDGLKKTSPHYWPPSKSAGFMPGDGGGDDLEIQIQAAAKSGNTALFRKLRDKQRELKSKK